MPIQRKMHVLFPEAPTTLLKFTDVSLASGTTSLLGKVSRQIGRDERVCMIGCNGISRSSLFRMVKDEQQADGSEVWRAPILKIGELSQELSCANRRTMFDVVIEDLVEVNKLLAEYHHLSLNIHTDNDLVCLSRVQQELKAHDGWCLQQLVDSTPSRPQLPADKTFAELSGGWRRRVLLARALVIEPDLLLLDEPTNHLDIGAITWLKEASLGFDGAVLFITHDRVFLQSLVTHILELDRGHLINRDGDYISFLMHKEQQLAAEEAANALFDKCLVQEEAWIHQGIKTRRTHDEGRVRVLKETRRERVERRERQGRANFQLESADESSKQAIMVEHVSSAHPGGQPLVHDFSVVLQCGGRIGLLGASDTGKTTSLKPLFGDLQPTSGKIEVSTKLEMAYFDQSRHQLKPEQTMIDNISEGREFVTIDGQNRHALSYLGGFLLSPQRACTLVRALSGGKRAYLSLAKPFSRPINLLMLDEPAGGLDVETLELLEEVLLGFQGTVLVVSHDRISLDNMVTSTPVSESEGKVREFVGGYQDWLHQGGTSHLLDVSELKSGKTGLNTALTPVAEPAPAAAAPSEALTKKKLSYKLQRELEALFGQIDVIEAEPAGAQETIAQQNPCLRLQDERRETLTRLDALQQGLDALLECQAELED